MTADGAAVIEAEGLVRRRGGRVVIDGASLVLAPGEAVALVGPSGCGKTTLLHILGLLDRPDGGTLRVVGQDPWAAGRAGGSARARSALRLGHIGFVFQQSNLLPFLTARDNVAVAAWRCGGSRRAALEASDALLARLGLGARAGTRGGVLSLGEAQRVAVARALVNRPSLILADEPTGSLDSLAMEEVLASFDEVVREGTALLVATHDPRVAERMRRTVRMHDGRLYDDEGEPAVTTPGRARDASPRAPGSDRPATDGTPPAGAGASRSAPEDRR